MSDNNNNIPITDINDDKTTESVAAPAESVAAPAVVPESKDDTIALGSNSDVSKDTPAVVPESKDDTIALGSNSNPDKVPESKDDSNTNDEYADAITTVTELLNKLNSAATAASPDDADDFKKAIDIATEMLNKLNADVNNTITVTPVDDVTDVTNVDGAATNGSDCGQRASIWSSADPSCYVVKDLPPIAEMIQAAFANEVSTAGREIVMNFLKGAGIQGIESAVLTPETIRQLDELSKNPEMKAKITALKLNLDNVAEQAMNNIENKVLPKAEKVLGGIEKNALDGVAAAIQGAGVGELVAVAKEAEAIAGVANKIPEIGTEIEAELKPLQDLKNSIPVLPVLPDVAGAAAGAAAGATNAAAGAATGAAAGAAAGATNAAAGATNAAAGATNAAAGAADAAAGATNAAASTASDAATKAAVVTAGGSRRIHRLSRRIDKLSRRVQKKYGLKDKNSFLRRTLKK